MTPADIVERISRFFEERLGELRPLDSEGKERKISIYRYNLPSPAPTKMAADGDPQPDEYEGMMPAVVVAPVSFEDKAFEDGASLMTVSIMACAYADDAGNVNGPRSILNVLERIRRLLLTYRVIDQVCEIQEPLSWQLYDETTKPLWFGETLTQWRVVVPDRMDEEDWRGDLIVG